MRAGERWTIYAIVFLDMLGLGFVTPALADIGLRFHVGPIPIALLVAAFPVMQCIFGYCLGLLSDKIDRKQIIVACLAVYAAGYLTFAVAPVFSVLLVARAFVGAAAGSVPVLQGYISDHSSREEVASEYGRLGLFISTGFISGQVAIGLTGYNAGGHVVYAIPAVITAGLAAVLVPFAVVLLRQMSSRENQPDPTTGTTHASVILGILWPYIVLYGLSALVFNQFAITAVYWVSGAVSANVHVIALIFVTIAVVVGVVQGVVFPVLTKLVSLSRIVVVGSTLYVLAFATASLAANWAIVLGATICFASSAFALLTPAVLAEIEALIPPHLKGEAFGLATVSENIGATVGPLIAGVALEATRTTGAWMALLAASVCTASCAYASLNHAWRRRQLMTLREKTV